MKNNLPRTLNKSFLTNFVAIICIIVGWLIHNNHIKTVGYYAFSGAITNWAAIYMLFEKVPFLYGSGVIPSRFNEFKQGIKNLIMEQFFSETNIDKFFSRGDIHEGIRIDANAITESFDYKNLFTGLVDAIIASKFGSMLSMVGGRSALDSLEEPITDKLKQTILSVLQSKNFPKSIASHISGIDSASIRKKIQEIVDQRLDELSPQMVKMIIQNMIRQHLGWLVIWGGVFGGIIGAIVSFGG